MMTPCQYHRKGFRSNYLSNHLASDIRTGASVVMSLHFYF